MSTATATAQPPVLLSFRDVLRIPVMRRVWYAQVVSLFGDFLALFAVIAVVSFLLSAGSGVAGRRVLVLVLTAVWGLRLGAHIYTRNRGQGEDKRYASLLRRN